MACANPILVRAAHNYFLLRAEYPGRAVLPLIFCGALAEYLDQHPVVDLAGEVHWHRVFITAKAICAQVKMALGRLAKLGAELHRVIECPPPEVPRQHELAGPLNRGKGPRITAGAIE